MVRAHSLLWTAFFINLEHDQERRVDAEQHFRGQGFEPRRFSVVILQVSDRLAYE